jgi:protein-S-isoprenylcysteine O-methyltransferase Ste14
MKSLELKIPPPIVALGVVVLMWLASRLAAPLEVPLAMRVTAAVILLGIGIGLAFVGVTTFRRNGTTINPHQPQTATSLVSGGIYRFTRNPMYLGFLFDLLAWAAYLSNAAALLVALGFVLYMNRFQIIPEERALASLFGDEYAAYKRRVRRWV